MPPQPDSRVASPGESIFSATVRSIALRCGILFNIIEQDIRCTRLAQGKELAQQLVGIAEATSPRKHLVSAERNHGSAHAREGVPAPSTGKGPVPPILRQYVCLETLPRV